MTVGRATPEIPAEWVSALAQQGYDTTDAVRLADRLCGSIAGAYPPRRDVFLALRSVLPADIRVVILGQDPYFKIAGQAHGLAFSVPAGIDKPRALRAVFRAISRDLGSKWQEPASGDLTGWATQGVLLLNAALTVPAGGPRGRHLEDWQDFVDAVLQVVRAKDDPVAYLIWGDEAERRIKAAGGVPTPHRGYRNAHPTARRSVEPKLLVSPPFSKVSSFVRLHGGDVHWRL